MAHPVGKPGRDVLRLLRLDQPTVGEAQRTYEGNRAGRTGQPDQIPANWPRLAEAGGRGWRPRLEAALSLIWRWRGVHEGAVADASGRLISTWQRARRPEGTTRQQQQPVVWLGLGWG